MPKTVPIAEEKAFLRLDKRFRETQLQYELAKAKIHKYREKGYTFTLLRFSDTTEGVLSIPWKTVALELMARFMNKATRKGFMESLVERFPKVSRTPSVLVPGKEKVDA